MHRLPSVNKTLVISAKKSVVESNVRINSKRFVGSFLGRFVFSNNDDKYFDRKVPEKQKRDVREKKVKEVTRVVKANDIIKGVNDDENTVSDKEKKEKEDPKYFPNLVERKIREAMANGEFKNLPYKYLALIPNSPFSGKPMPGIYDEKSSWVDPTEEWCYSMLKRNGFAPEWVELNKTIHEEIRQARRRLEQEFERITIEPRPVVSAEETQRSLLALFYNTFNIIFSRKPKEEMLPNSRKMTFEEKEQVWRSAITSFEISIKIINEKIFTYNLMVPMSRQLFQYNLQDELEKITGGRDPIAGNERLFVA